MSAILSLGGAEVRHIVSVTELNSANDLKDWLHEYQAAAMQCCLKKMLLHKKWNFHSNYLDDAELCVLMSFTHKVFLCLIILWGHP